MWLDATSNAPANVITAQTYNGMVDAQIAAGQEMYSATVPADLSAQSTTSGLGAWDALSGADAATRTAAMDAIGAEGAWAGLGATFPSFALGVGAFYVGWQVGTAIDTLLGIDSGTGTAFGGGLSVTPAAGNALTYYPAGTDLFAASGLTCSSGCTAIHAKLPTASWVVRWSNSNNWVREMDPAVAPSPNPDNGSCDYSVSQRPPGGAWVDILKTDMVTSSSCFGPPAPPFPIPSALITKVYVIPAQTANVPGPGQSGNPLTQTVTTAYTGPNEAGKRTGASRMLSDPTYDAWQRWYCSFRPDDCGGPLPTPAGVTTVTIPSITPGETYGQYAAALQSAGVLGRITDVTLSDAAADPSLGPYSVVSTSPSPGTRVAPETNVQVMTNPATTPGSAPGGGAPGTPALPGVVVPTAATPCNVFPFGIPCWLSSQLNALSSTATAPSFSIGLPAAICGRGCALNVNLDHPFGADLSAVMATARPILLVLSFVGLVVWLAGIALGGSTGGGGSAEAED